MGQEILKPLAVLAGWTMVMWIWMYATRIPAINKLPKPTEPGADAGWTGAMLENLIPREIQWKAHNYNHLHEAPTVFYAVALALAFIGQGGGLNAKIAWAYVILRIIHSVWQATVNKLMPRFMLFALSSLCLMALTVHLLIAVFH
ncbi:MAG: MAPEG family protein [Novosphingobium sp.]